MGSAAGSTLALAISSLHEGVAGLAYLDRLVATGGETPYRFRVAGLPRGLQVDEGGVIDGTPEEIGTFTLTATVEDASGSRAEGSVVLAVPSSLPAECLTEACERLTPDGETVQIDGSRISSVVRAPTDGEVEELVISPPGPVPSPGQVVVVPSVTGLPSGLVAVVDSAAPLSFGETALAVEPATMADAYAEGTVKTEGEATTPAGLTKSSAIHPKRSTATTTTSRSPRRLASTGSLSCGGGVSDQLHGLAVKPTLTPNLTAIWHHPYLAAGGFYPGAGGLELFQFDLGGQITVQFGVSVSGAADCTLRLPAVRADAPAGELGAVVLETTPSLELQTDGKVDIHTSVTLSCGVEYRWDEGTEYHGDYCGDQEEPLHLTSASGVDATLTGRLEAAVSLDDIVGVDGSISADVHAGYRPTGDPVAEVDAGVGYELGACLLCLWKGSPARVTVAQGTLFQKTLYSSDSAPPPVAPGEGGSEEPGSGGGADFLATLSEGSWSAVTVPVPLGGLAGSGWLTGPVTCPGDGECVAGGLYSEATGASRPMVAELSDGQWQAQPLDFDDPAPEDLVAGTPVCPAAGSCVIVFTHEGPTGEMVSDEIATLVEGEWTVTEASVPQGGKSDTAQLGTPTCSGPGHCLIGGTYVDPDHGEEPLIETQDGSGWSVGTTPFLPATGSDPACAAAGFCVAVGVHRDEEGDEGPYLDEWRGEGWSTVAAPLPADAASGSFGSSPEPPVCAAGGMCVALGSYVTASAESRGMVVRAFADGSSSAGPIAVPSGGVAGTGSLESIGCYAATACAAAGTYEVGGGGRQTMIERIGEDGLSAIAAPLPPDGLAVAGAPLESLLGCSAGGFCALPSSYAREGGGGGPMIIALAGGRWTGTPVSVPAGGVSGSGWVGGMTGYPPACSAAGVCLVAGAYEEVPEASQRSWMLVVGSGTEWSADAVPVPADGLPGSGYPLQEACSPDGLCAVTGIYHRPG